MKHVFLYISFQPASPPLYFELPLTILSNECLFKLLHGADTWLESRIRNDETFSNLPLTPRHALYFSYPSPRLGNSPFLKTPLAWDIVDVTLENDRTRRFAWFQPKKYDLKSFKLFKKGGGGFANGGHSRGRRWGGGSLNLSVSPYKVLTSF